MKSTGLGIVTIGFLMCGSFTLPTRAVAQGVDGKGSPTTGIEKQKVSLDLESSSLYYGLKLLFSQVKCNFTIDDDIKGLTVTAHFADVPFRIALETLLKSTSASLTYKFENGIYSVSPKMEEPPPSKDEQGNAGVVYRGRDVARTHLVRIYNVSDLDIVQAFGGAILNIGLIPGFGLGGTPPGQSQRARQNTGFFEGGENMYGAGHDTVIVATPAAGANQH